MYNKELRRWYVAVAVWVIVFIEIGITKAFGVLLPILQDEFKTQTWIIGTSVSLVAFSGNIVAILNQALLRFISTRAIIIVCTLVSTCGLIICTVAMRTWVLVFGLFLTGFLMVNYIFAVGALSKYFTTNYHVAANIVTTGLPAGIMCFAPITQILIDHYGWRGTTFLLAGIQFHVVAAALLLRPTSAYKNPPDSLTLKDGGVLKTCLTDIFKMSLIKNTRFIVVAVLHAFLGYSYNGWLVYMISIILNKGQTLNAAAYVLLVSGIGIMVTRIIMAFLPRDKFDRYLLYFGSLAMGVAFGGVYLANSYVGLCINNCFLGIGYGILGTMLYIVMNACVSVDDMTGAITWVTLIEGVGFYFGGYLTGWLFDMTGSYSLSLAALALMPLLMTAILGIEDCHRLLTSKEPVKMVNGYTQIKSTEH